jgi:hypothetical protein
MIVAIVVVVVIVVFIVFACFLRSNVRIYDMFVILRSATMFTSGQPCRPRRPHFVHHFESCLTRLSFT